MKKIALILMICIYALSSFGVGIKQFYCCGKLKSTTISFVQEAKGKCGMGNENSGCCKTEFKSLKVKDDHVAADGISNPNKHYIDLHLSTPSFDVMALAIEPMDIANASHAPPLNYGLPIYMLHCNFRI
ncbi:MAG: hypothetical protein JWP81_2499 [Ferruginibacter sp.]|nr:hypothetical protein [Ferruginibacter sp.]